MGQDVTVASGGPDALRRFVPVWAVVVAIGAVATDPGIGVENLVALVAALPFAVWAWRGMPTIALVLAVGVAAAVALRSGELEPLLFLLCVAATVVGAWEPSRRMAIGAGLLAVATPVAIEAVESDDILYGVWVMGIVLSLLLARAFRWQLSLATELADARQEIARQAVLDEKRRIARDVHDLVGHGLAAMLLHVTGARHVLRRDVDAAEDALVDAEAVGRRSLEDLRRTLAVLRSTDVDGVGGAAIAPLPGAENLVDVVQAARSRGLDVDFHTRGDRGRIDSVIGLSLHRVTEEALTNVLRHAPQTATDVVLSIGDDEVVLTVESVGSIKAAPAGEVDRPRYGVLGMRERMAAVGGDLEAGPVPTGWSVRARAPLTAASADGSADPGTPATTGAAGDTSWAGSAAPAHRASRASSGRSIKRSPAGGSSGSDGGADSPEPIPHRSLGRQMTSHGHGGTKRALGSPPDAAESDEVVPP